MPKPTPFHEVLKKKHTVKKLTSLTDTDEAQELQLLFNANNKIKYRKRERELGLLGKQFRVTKGIVYEMQDRGETLTIAIHLQVKGHSLTWYFWAPGAIDQYPQTFRDKLYNAAALAHKSVTKGCDLYYRGSNAVHIKLMHDHESESNHNHNHYRLINNQHYTPVDFSQHLLALKQSEIHDEFFALGEIDALCDKFTFFHANWTSKVDRALSLEEEYFAHESQRLEPEDIIELGMFGQQQEPCRINTAELKIDYELARKEITDAIAAIKTDDGTTAQREKAATAVLVLENRLKVVQAEYEELIKFRQIGGSRGLNSAIAPSRQIKGSDSPVVKQSVGMDDTLGKEVPDVPAWAKKLLEEVELAKKKLLASAIERLDNPLQVDIPSDSTNLNVSTIPSPSIVSDVSVLVKTPSPKMVVEVATPLIVTPSVPPKMSVDIPAYQLPLSSSSPSLFESFSVFAQKDKMKAVDASSIRILGVAPIN